MPHWFLVQVGGEFRWLKVWKGQVNRGFGFYCHFLALGFSGSKATLSLKGRISWLWVNWLKHSEFVVLESQKVCVHLVGYTVSGNLLSKLLKLWWETSPNKAFKADSQRLATSA
ncbi:hypothetical protein [Vibrio vulnificus]|uniref:hypothetical protein n=1 Tax=Vibrio vulnificus TaxID=672 RepID=UPI00376AE833